MATTSSAKICRLCHKDVSNAKRVKDAQGNYYCQPCHDEAVKRQPGAASQAVSASGSVAPRPVAAKPPIGTTPAARASAIKPIAAPTVAASAAAKPKPAPAPAAAPAPASSGPKPLPKFCPNCNAPVLAGRKLCFKCKRDVTQMDRLIAMKEEAAKGPSAEERTAEIISRVIRGVIWIVVLAIVGFVGFGVYSFFFPTGPWDRFPTKRVDAAHDFVTFIAGGNEKSFDKAVKLVSVRTLLATNNDQEPDNFKRMFAKINDEFTQKYGADWIKKAQFADSAPSNNSPVRSIDVIIDNDIYHVEVSAQFSDTEAVMNMRSAVQYPENGKVHFGVIGVEEYPLHPSVHRNEKGEIVADFIPKPDHVRGGIKRGAADEAPADAAPADAAPEQPAPAEAPAADQAPAQ